MSAIAKAVLLLAMEELLASQVQATHINQVGIPGLACEFDHSLVTFADFSAGNASFALSVE